MLNLTVLGSWAATAIGLHCVGYTHEKKMEHEWKFCRLMHISVTVSFSQLDTFF